MKKKGLGKQFNLKWQFKVMQPQATQTETLELDRNYYAIREGTAKTIKIQLKHVKKFDFVPYKFG